MYTNRQLFKKSLQFSQNTEDELEPSSTQNDYVLVHNLGHSELTLLNSLVASAGYRVIQVNSISSAVEKCLSNLPAAVIGDCTFDKDEALQLIKSARQIKGMNKVPFLYFCEKGTSPAEILRQEHGNFEYLFKPVLAGQLRTRLDSMMQSKNWRQNIPSLPGNEINIESQNEQLLKRMKNTLVSTRPKPAITPVVNLSIKSTDEFSPEKPPVKFKVEDGFYDNAVDLISEQIERIKRNEKISLKTFKSLAVRLVKQIANGSALEVNALNFLEKRSLPIRITNMVIFAVMIGQRLKLSKDDILKLTTVGFIHDLGMVLISDNLLEQSDQLTEVEYNQVKKHIDYTNDLINTADDYLPAIDDLLAEISCQVHEREDGSGYPRGLKSRDINILAKILAVADRFVALCHPRHYRIPFVGHEALQRIVRIKEGGFDPKVIKALVMELTIFPVSSLIELNNRQIGRVISTNKSHPLRPVVEIIFDESGNRLIKPNIIDLKETPFLYIAKTILSDELHK
jgi:HD-GYP domain-containing protein (c-di-GMP phosphodiesterase class II)